MWADGHGTLVCGVATGSPGPALFTSGDRGDNWWPTESGYPDSGAREAEPEEILLRNGCHVRTRGGTLHFAPQLGAWDPAPGPAGVISLGQAGAFTFAAGSGKLWKFHVGRPWEEVGVPAQPLALSRTDAGVPLVAGMSGNGVWRLWNWGSAEPEWESALNETFPTTPVGKPLGVVRVAIDRECRLVCVQAWDHAAVRMRMLACATR